MRSFKGTVSTNRNNSTEEFYFEVEDDATDEQIEIEAKSAMLECIDWDFEEDQEEC